MACALGVRSDQSPRHWSVGQEIPEEALGIERPADASLPNIPAMSEILPTFVSMTWYGVVAPPKTPMPIAEKLSAAIADTLKQPEVAKRLSDLSAEPIGNTPGEMGVATLCR